MKYQITFVASHNQVSFPVYFYEIKIDIVCNVILLLFFCSPSVHTDLIVLFFPDSLAFYFIVPFIFFLSETFVADSVASNTTKFQSVSHSILPGLCRNIV